MLQEQSQRVISYLTDLHTRIQRTKVEKPYEVENTDLSKSQREPTSSQRTVPDVIKALQRTLFKKQNIPAEIQRELISFGNETWIENLIDPFDFWNHRMIKSPELG